MMRQLLTGAAAGAAGTAALNAVTYADMALRGRPASDTPERVVEQAEDELGRPLPGSDEERANRRSGVGALLGIATGVGVGATYGLLRGVGLRVPTWLGAVLLGATAMTVSNGPMTAMGITNPRTWSRADWLSDVIPHVAYGAVAAAVYSGARPISRTKRRNVENSWTYPTRSKS
jgi:hypothetical protein